MKKMFKKPLSFLLAAAMCTALSACGSAGTAETSAADVSATQTSAADTAANTTADQSASGEAGSTDASPPAADPVTLRFAWWGGDSRHEATLKAIELYQERNPHVTIEGEYQGYDGYYEKMMTTLSSGTAPDLFQFSRDWIADVQGAKHYLADLSQLPVDTSTLREGLLERSGSFNGEPLMFSAGVGAQVLFVNTDFASQYGIDLTKQYTWNEMIELGKTINEADADAHLMTADIDVLNRLIILSLISQQTGTSIVDEDTYELAFTQEQMTTALQCIVDLYESGTLEPFGEAAVFVGQMDQNNKWLNGKIGILMDGTSGGPKYETAMPGKLEVMKIPVLENAVCNGVDFGGNMGICINDSSASKEEAAKFLDFMMNDGDAIEILQTTRGFCPTEKAEEILAAKGLLNDLQKKGVTIAQEGSYSINAISGNTELETIRKNVIQEVIYGDSTPAEGAAEIVEQYQLILEKLKAEK